MRFWMTCFIVLVSLIFIGCKSLKNLGPITALPENTVNDCMDIECEYIPPSYFHNKKVEIDPDLQQYVDNFVGEACIRGVNIVIDDLIVKFKKIGQTSEDSTILGRCTKYAHDTPEVAIDPRYWGDLTDTTKTALMFHELGHCVLKRNHIDDIDSIMNTYIIDDEVYLSNRDALLDELFDEEKFYTFGLYDPEILSCPGHE